jgi:hypothetical protein
MTRPPLLQELSTLSPRIRSIVQMCDVFNTLELHHMSFSPSPYFLFSLKYLRLLLPIPFSVQVPANQFQLEGLHESLERNHKRRPIRPIPHYMKRAPVIENSQPLATINIHECPSLTCFLI